MSADQKSQDSRGAQLIGLWQAVILAIIAAVFGYVVGPIVAHYFPPTPTVQTALPALTAADTTVRDIPANIDCRIGKSDLDTAYSYFRKAIYASQDQIANFAKAEGGQIDVARRNALNASLQNDVVSAIASFDVYINQLVETCGAK